MIEVELGARVGADASCGTSVRNIIITIECDIIYREYVSRFLEICAF